MTIISKKSGQQKLLLPELKEQIDKKKICSLWSLCIIARISSWGITIFGGNFNYNVSSSGSHDPSLSLNSAEDTTSNIHILHILSWICIYKRMHCSCCCFKYLILRVEIFILRNYLYFRRYISCSWVFYLIDTYCIAYKYKRYSIPHR